jgi:hypothetical protein
MQAVAVVVTDLGRELTSARSNNGHAIAGAWRRGFTPVRLHRFEWLPPASRSVQLRAHLVHADTMTRTPTATRVVLLHVP